MKKKVFNILFIIITFCVLIDSSNDFCSFYYGCPLFDYINIYSLILCFLFVCIVVAFISDKISLGNLY